MKLLKVAALTAMSVAGLVAQQPGDAQPRKVGDIAPNFTLTGTTGGKGTLADFKGKNPVVLAFFPAAFTGG